MHDPVYRVAVSWQNSSYNQPPHPGYYVANDIDFHHPVPTVKPDAGFNRGSGEIIKDLMVYDDLNAIKWQVLSNLNSSETVYGDRTYFPSQMPDYLLGSEWIKTSIESRGFENNDGLASFKVLQKAKVYVMHQSSAANKPEWLSGFTLNAEKVVLTVPGQAPAEMSVYEAEVDFGDTVVLGTAPDNQQMYFVAAQKADTVTNATIPAFIADGELNVYPNPFSSHCTINYILKKDSYVSVDVFDLMGKQIHSLINEKKPVGNYSVTFNGAHLSDGIYIVKLKTDNQIVQKKILLSK